MTRGTLFLITDWHIYKSCEFNGDMYPDGHGRLATELLERVETTQQFYAIIQLFNELNHKYKDDYPLVRVEASKNLVSDFNNEYFDHWFSDWIFIKNISKEPIIFDYRFNIDDGEQKQSVEVKHGELIVANFGYVPDTKDREFLGLDNDGIKRA